MKIPNAVRLRITLAYLDPAPMREVDIRLSSSLKVLHDTIQAVFCWLDYHLWEFEVAGTRYGMEKDVDFDGKPIHLAKTTKLAELFERDLKRFTYTYDFGDDWLHIIDCVELLSVGEEEKLPRLVGGQYRTPPEDIGGPPGYEHFLEVSMTPDHPDIEDYEHMLETPFDQTDIQQELIKANMQALAKRKTKKK